MPTYAENLETARNQIAALIVDLTANPKPDYSVDGKSISWGAYLSQLQGQLAAMDEALQRADGPWEVESRGVT